jgi:hypothetical protein
MDESGLRCQPFPSLFPAPDERKRWCSGEGEHSYVHCGVTNGWGYQACTVGGHNVIAQRAAVALKQRQDMVFVVHCREGPIAAQAPTPMQGRAPTTGEGEIMWTCATNRSPSLKHSVKA